MGECHCRFCGSHLTLTFANLGMSPLSNAYLDEDGLHRMEPYYPLHARVCDSCWLVQVEAFESPEAIFGDYAYFSSYSDSWLRHVQAYVQSMIARFDLGAGSSVIEIASNDGHLLQYFGQAGVPVLGIEPARNIAAVAEQKGIRTLCQFFGSTTARQLVADGQQADLLLGNNVLAHVPDLNDFVAGLRILLRPQGVITLEFPHLLRLIADNQFDTIYHEHFSYFSLLTVEQVLARHGLSLFDVEELPTHGGSLRIFARHTETKLPLA
ncbi:MAG: methyltransferase domain-containing protein, partial [Betaproteobacteria bacterium]|nr:methyltransferase domain-containing protein [Betaproteobacteria bacterium]